MGGATERERMTEIAATLKPDDAINIQFTGKRHRQSEGRYPKSF